MLEEEARDHLEKTTVGAKYLPRSNDKTLDEEARHRNCRSR
jgi:hypothetical protein